MFLFSLIAFVFVVVLTVSIAVTFARVVGKILGVIAPRREVIPLPPIAPVLPTSLRCRRSNCRAVNPNHARFCRQCGMSISASTPDYRVGNGAAPRAASRLAG